MGDRMSERWLAGTATQFLPLCPSQKLSRSFFRGYENSRKHLVQPRVEVIIPCNLHELVHLDSGSDGAVAVGAVLVAKPAGKTRRTRTRAPKNLGWTNFRSMQAGLPSISMPISG